MSDDMIFCGSGKERFNGNQVAVSLCIDDVPEEHIREFRGKKYIQLNVCKKKNGVDEYGKTHYVTVNTYRPPEEALNGRN